MPVVETIAVLASIVAIIQISDRIAGICKFYLQSVSGTPPELRAILVEVLTLKSILECLQFMETCYHETPALWKQLSGQDGPIEACRLSMVELEKLLPTDVAPSNTTGSKSKKRKVNLALASLAWPFHSPRARELLQKIIQQKTMITLALTTESVQDIKSINVRTEKIHQALTGSQRREVFRWLEVTDPSLLHNKACTLHEPSTGQWILRSPEWENYLSGDTRCLWIHGIPGAGKTILCSFLIEQIRTYCKAKDRVGVAYYYCYYVHNQEEATPFIRWVIAQLCRQVEIIPDSLHELFNQGGQPSLADLLLALDNVLQFFDTAYIIIDAIDESKPRTDLLRVLRDLATDLRFAKIRCLVTSREYTDIEDTLTSISTSISMNDPLAAEDIRIYIRSELRSQPRLQKFANLSTDVKEGNPRFQEFPDFRADIEEALVNGSKGMFRWAVCQIDRLKRWKCDRDFIKKELRSLPKTLDETYDRIFQEIPEDDWPFANHALQWIFFHKEIPQNVLLPCSPLSMQILLAATEASTAQHNHHDAESLRTMLGCLIFLDENDCVSLAHYTVNEYLESQRISTSTTIYFRTGQEQMIKRQLRIVLDDVHAIGESLDLGTLDVKTRLLASLFTDLPVYCLWAGAPLLLKYAKDLVNDESLFDRAVKFLHLRLTISLPAGNLLGTVVYSNCHEIIGIDWKVAPANHDAVILLQILMLEVIGLDDEPKSAIQVLADHFIRTRDITEIARSRLAFRLSSNHNNNCKRLYDGSLLEVMGELSSACPTSFSWLLEVCGSLVDADLIHVYIGWHSSICRTYGYRCHGRYECALWKMLDRGVNPNALGHQVTTLQIAVASGDLSGVKALLEAGADASATGDPQGSVFKEGTRNERLNGLHGLSPMYINRNMQPHKWTEWRRGWRREEPQQVIAEIEALLLHYGARDFKSSGELGSP